MDEDQLQSILGRLDAIESRVASIERRMYPVAPPVTPPKVPAHITEVAWTTPPPSGMPPPVQQERPVAAVANASEIEYNIGAKLLPRVGAVALVAGISYAASIALNRGLITPAMIFGFLCVVCVAFMGFGFWKRSEKEQFGDLVTAVGSAGLFVNFAAGHSYQHLYEGKTLLMLFLAHSVLNLGYSLWRGSKAFWALGSFGGFIAACMPLDQHNAHACLILTLLVVAAGAAVVARHKWQGGAVTLWLAGLAIEMYCPILPSRGQVFVWIPYAMVLTSMVCVAAHAFSYQESSTNARAGAGLWMTWLTAVALIATWSGKPECSHFAIGLAACTIPIAFLTRNEKVRRRIWLGAALAAFTVGPVMAPHGQWGVLYAGLAIFGCVVAVASGWTEALLVALAELAVTFGVYFANLDLEKVVAREELPLLGTVFVAYIAFVGAATMLHRKGSLSKDTAGAFLPFATLLGAAVFTRFGFVGAIGSYPTVAAQETVLFSIEIYTLVVGGFVLWFRKSLLGAETTVSVLIFAVIATTWSYLSWVTLNPRPAAEVPAIFLLALQLPLVAAFLSKLAPESDTERGVVVALGGWLLFSRLGVVLLAASPWHVAVSPAVTIVWVLSIALSFGIGMALNFKPMRYLGYVVTLMTVSKIVLLDLADLDAGVKVLILIALGMVLMGFGYWNIRRNAAKLP